MEKIRNSSGAARSILLFLDCMELFQLSHSCKAWRSILSPKAAIWELAAERDWQALLYSMRTLRPRYPCPEVVHCDSCKTLITLSWRRVQSRIVCDNCWFALQRSRMPAARGKKRAFLFIASLFDARHWCWIVREFIMERRYRYCEHPPIHSDKCLVCAAFIQLTMYQEAAFSDISKNAIQLRSSASLSA